MVVIDPFLPDLFHKRAFERLCASDDHKSEITESVDLCDYDCIIQVRNVFSLCGFLLFKATNLS